MNCAKKLTGPKGINSVKRSGIRKILDNSYSVITFRNRSIRTLRIGENEYKMLENVQILEWKYIDEKLKPGKINGCH
jgi:hypothetical protein